MNRIFQIITIVLMSTTIPFFSSCKDDESISEWDMSYVSLLPVDYLKPTPFFSLKHIEEEGIEGSVEYQFMVVTQKASNQDIKVNLEAVCDGISENKINLTTKTAVIKAGSTQSDVITLNIDNWDDLLAIKEEADYTLNIKISGMEASENVVLSEYRQQISIKISKSKEKEKESVLLTDPSKWIFTFMDGVENAASNSVAGTGNSDVATNGIPFWFTVDFIEEKTLTGIKTSHWGSTYAPTKIELFISEDNDRWTSIGQFETSGSVQEIRFEERIKTKYLKYQMIDVPSRVDITRFYVYSWE
ncbi:DUF4999 domain-containing protein [uncultured Bacteroides sp.]|uniref:DUF4999 domain-containing protein n=1 Tax=uncultured Bacteroides sp. TaxID=162156 RepID=UPI0026744137|nr:DUF4999 domain-containing protein [uncultured Bacteroides sp.]